MVIIMHTSRVMKWSGITMFLRILEIFDFVYSKVINAVAYQRIAFYFVLAAIYYRRHFGKAETVQSPARFRVDLEICDFVYSKGY